MRIKKKYVNTYHYEICQNFGGGCLYGVHLCPLWRGVRLQQAVNTIKEERGFGTFYSGISNVNIRIGKGNPMAIGLRTHLAQHGVLSHVTIYGGDGFACLYDVNSDGSLSMSDKSVRRGDYAPAIRRHCGRPLRTLCGKFLKSSIETDINFY